LQLCAIAVYPSAATELPQDIYLAEYKGWSSHNCPSSRHFCCDSWQHVTYQQLRQCFNFLLQISLILEQNGGNYLKQVSFPSYSFIHKDISMTYPYKTIEISKVMLTKIWISVMIKLKAWGWPVWPKHVAWYSYQTNKGVLTEWFYIKFISRILQVNINLGKYFWQRNWQCIIHIKSKCHKNLCIENIKKERNTDLEISKPCRWRLYSFKILGNDYPMMHHTLRKSPQSHYLEKVETLTLKSPN
jgi:hypothetical protein